jgi:hypothetical protein
MRRDKTMNTTVLRKENLIEMLMKIDSQLEQLDCSLVSNISQQNKRWESEQEIRLNSCFRQLERLEQRMASEKENLESNATTFRLKLSC